MAKRTSQHTRQRNVLIYRIHEIMKIEHRKKYILKIFYLFYDFEKMERICGEMCDQWNLTTNRGMFRK